MEERQVPIAGIIVAAPPRRPHADWHGKPVLQSVLTMASSWPLQQPLVTVFSKETEALLDSVDLGGSVAVIDEDGSDLASALRVALDAVTRLLPDVAGALVIDGDVPDVPDKAVDALIAEFEHSGHLAVTPTYRYVRSGPVVIGRRLWDRVVVSGSDQRLEELLAAHPEWTSNVVISESAPEPVA